MVEGVRYWSGEKTKVGGSQFIVFNSLFIIGFIFLKPGSH